MRLKAGTSGFAYKAWKGSFYPAKLKDAEMLPFYAERLAAVEINNTFYRLPSAKLLDDWAAKVPEDFAFVLKASRKITHFKKLVGAEDELGYFLEVSGRLGPRLGPYLFQLPPYLKKDLGRLGAFLNLLPAGTRAAFEFRSSSWFDDEVYTALADRGIALAISDMGDEPPPVVATADYGYARLRREAYPEADLETWATRLSAQPWSHLFVFFKHEDEGAGPRLAARFAELFPT